MSQWFKNRRQEFIAATLRTFGQVRRVDIMREFDVSAPQAANDIAEFMATEPPLVRYDVSAKAYSLEDGPSTVRGVTEIISIQKPGYNAPFVISFDGVEHEVSEQQAGMLVRFMTERFTDEDRPRTPPPPPNRG